MEGNAFSPKPGRWWRETVTYDPSPASLIEDPPYQSADGTLTFHGRAEIRTGGGFDHATRVEIRTLRVVRPPIWDRRYMRVHLARVIRSWQAKWWCWWTSVRRTRPT